MSKNSIRFAELLAALDVDTQFNYDLTEPCSRDGSGPGRCGAECLRFTGHDGAFRKPEGSEDAGKFMGCRVGFFSLSFGKGSFGKRRHGSFEEGYTIVHLG